MGVPAVPAGSPSSFDRCNRPPAPILHAVQWWFASQCRLRTASIAIRASCSLPTRTSEHMNRDLRTSISITESTAIVRSYAGPMWYCQSRARLCPVCGLSFGINGPGEAVAPRASASRDKITASPRANVATLPLARHSRCCRIAAGRYVIHGQTVQTVRLPLILSPGAMNWKLHHRTSTSRSSVVAS